jgi:hypothetical protein
MMTVGLAWCELLRLGGLLNCPDDAVRIRRSAKDPVNRDASATGEFGKSVAQGEQSRLGHTVMRHIGRDVYPRFAADENDPTPSGVGAT